MKKKTMFITAILLAGMMMPGLVFGQDEEESSNLTFGADVVSRYIWRGINLGGSTPHVQPYVEYAFGESGLAIGAWGSYSTGLGLAGAEADLYISWSPIDALNLTITDYFFPADQAFERNDYFNYKKKQTGHTLEAMLTVGGTESFPLYATFAMNFYGADGLNEKGESYNAKYIEVGYGKEFGDTALDIFLGVAPDNPKTDEGGEGWYGESAGIINLGFTVSKSLRIADKTLPVFSSMIFNPEAGNFYLVLGLSF